MMEERFDTEALIERASEIAKEIRQSDAYPAIVGGIAGGIAGALMAAIIASRFSPTRSDSTPSATRESRNSIALRDWVQLLGVVAGLVKQAREWYYQEKGRR